MRIGFIQATNTNDVQWWPSLAFGYLKSYLEKYFGNFVEMNRITEADISNYDIIAISSTSQDYIIAKKIATTAKNINPKIITIIGGSHITFLPDTLGFEFDFGVIGEGEKTFLELITHLYNKQNVDDLQKIDGLVFHNNESRCFTPVRKMIDSIDDIPFPYRESASEPHIITSRGCPYKCNFCSSSVFWERIRFHSADYVVKEIEFLLSLNAFTIPIQDDLFVANKKRFKDIIDKISEKNLLNSFSAWVPIRANLVDDELCKQLKIFPAGAAMFGAESGSNRILELMDKRSTVEINQRAIDLLYDYGIKVGVSFIIGWPTETEEELRCSYEFLIRNIKSGKLPKMIPMNILMPLPGTNIWNYAIKEGVINLHNFNWGRLGIFASRNSINEWAELRRKNNTIYLNEKYVPQEKLYQIMKEYEDIISVI